MGLLDELGLGPVVLAGYDIGSRIAQTVARQSPERVRALVVTPPMPGAGQRLLDPGRPDRSSGTRTSTGWTSPPGCWTATGTPSARYLEHFWTHWSGPSYTPADADLDRLAESYGRPGAFTASIGWYRQGPGILVRGLAEQAPAPDERLAVRTHVLWPAHDPLFPAAWADRLDEFFADVT